MDLMQIVSSVPGIGPFLPYVAFVVALAAFLARFMPPPAAGASTGYAAAYWLVNRLAQNDGHAANAPTKADP